MDHEVPAYQGVGGDDNLRALDNYFFFSHEPLELLLRGDGGGAEKEALESSKRTPSLIDDLPDPPPPLLPTYYTAGNPSGKETPSEAEMASWLCQVFGQEPRGAATAPTIKSEGGNVVLSSCGGAGVAAGGEAECRRGPSSSGRRRSCSGKAAGQRRRTKISDKLRTLQQMLPECTKVKTGQASTLEEVIKYVKSLQHQVQTQVMAASGYAIPTPIWSLGGTMPLPWMQLPPGHVLGRQAPVMLPPYPVFSMVHTCAPHGPDVEPDGPGGRQQQLLAPRRHLVPNELTMPSHRGGSQK